MILAMRVGDGPTTEREFEEFSRRNPLVRVELSEKGDLIVAPPVGGWSARCELELARQVYEWCKGTGYGLPFGSQAGFTLPDGSIRSPDVAVVRTDRYDELSRAQQDGFLPLCPDIIVEIVSRSDQRSDVQEKLAMFREQGCRATMLFDPIGFAEVHDSDGSRSADSPATMSLRIGDCAEPLAFDLQALYRTPQ